MKKLFVLLCSMMLISSVVAAQTSTRTGGGNPYDLVPFPRAGSVWFSTALNINKKTFEQDGEEDISISSYQIVPSLTYAFNNRIAINTKIGFIAAGKEMSVTPPIAKTKVKSGITDPTFGIAFRLLDAARNSKNNLNLNLSLSPSLSKQKFSEPSENKFRVNSVSGKNVATANIAYSKDISTISIGANLGVTYNGTRKTKYSYFDELSFVLKTKSSIDFNVGAGIQFKGIEKVALDFGLDYTRYGKLNTKYEGRILTAQKSFGQLGSRVAGHFNVAKHFIMSLEWQYKFDAKVKGTLYDFSEDTSDSGKWEQSENFISINATAVF